MGYLLYGFPPLAAFYDCLIIFPTACVVVSLNLYLEVPGFKPTTQELLDINRRLP